MGDSEGPNYLESIYWVLGKLYVFHMNYLMESYSYLGKQISLSSHFIDKEAVS